MQPGEIATRDDDIVLNEGSDVLAPTVANTGDRPVQVGSHDHFAETSAALDSAGPERSSVSTRR